MAKKTMRERFIQALKAEGAIQVESRTRAYVVLSKPGVTWYYYVGKSGAVRRGNTARGSLPISQKRKDELLASVPAE